MREKYDLLIFDWDGTLIDSIEWIVQCIQRAAEQCHCPVPAKQQAKDHIGLSLQGLMQGLYPDADDTLIKKLMECYCQYYATLEINQEHLFDGVYQTMQELRNLGFQLAIATGKSRRGLDSAMRATGMESFFDSTRCADETASKPDPLMLNEILAVTGVNNHRSLMIGDSAHDMAMAVEAEIDCIAVSSGVHDSEILSHYAPLHCLQRTPEILNLL